MNPLDRHFHHQQSRMSSKGRHLSGQQAVARLFSPIAPDSMRNEQRLAEYLAKRESLIERGEALARRWEAEDDAMVRKYAAINKARLETQRQERERAA